MPPTIQVSPKQTEVLGLIRDRSADEIFLIGSVGTSKTFALAYGLINIAWQYPDSYIPVGRRTLADARKSTLFSFIEVLEKMHLYANIDYRLYGEYGGNDVKFVFTNKSVIQFVPLDHTKDREGSGVKGILATAAGVDEVDGVNGKLYTDFAARVGRKNDNGAPAVIINTCNPNETWVKDEIYLPYRKGRLPPRKAVVEFNITDSFLYPSGFYSRYDTNPKQWRERYLNNNWEYLDDDQSLFKSRVLDNIEVPQLPDGVDSFAGQDVAREGKDRNVLARIDGNVLADIVIYNKDDLDHFASDKEKEAPPYLHILGRQFIKYCQANNVGYQNGAGDAVGLGAGFIDYCRSQEFFISEYKAGSKPIPKPLSAADKKAGKKAEAVYDMLRSQIAWSLAEDMQNGNFFIYEGCPYVGELKKELLYHNVKTTDKLMRLESKEQVKQRLGKSPDIADAVFIAYWKARFKRVATFNLTPDPTNNPEGKMPGARETERPITGGLMSKSF